MLCAPTNERVITKTSHFPAQPGSGPEVALRIAVAAVLRMLPGGVSQREILSNPPASSRKISVSCLRIAAASEMEREPPPTYPG